MLPTSLQIPPATGIIQSSQEPVPASASLVAGETLLEQLTLSRELFPSEVRQAMRGLHPGLQQGDTPDIRITPALSDGSQVRVDLSRAGEVTLSVVVAGDTTRSVVVIPTHPAWGHLCAIPEQQRLINEWNGWANEPCPEQDKRMQAREAMLDCLLSGGKELKLNGLELTSLPQHFPPGLTVLDVSNNKLSRLPELPRTLNSLDASFNMLTSLPRYPGGLQELDINHNKLNLLPALPSGLKSLNASDNAFTRLPLLPEGMTEIDASNNRLTTLQKLPRSLITLLVENNLLSKIPELPVGLQHLNVNENTLTQIPELPQTLILLKCNEKVLREIPDGLEVLTVIGNTTERIKPQNPLMEVLQLLLGLPFSLTSVVPNKTLNSILQNLPGGLTSLTVQNTYVERLPTLPETLKHLTLVNNGLKTLPMLHNGMESLFAEVNELTSLPKLPHSLKLVHVSLNYLSELPELPDSVEELRVDHNELTRIPRLPAGLKILDFSHNQVSVMPKSHAGLEMNCDENPVSIPMVTCWFPDEQRADTLQTWKPLLTEAHGEDFTRFLSRLRISSSTCPPEFRAYVSAWLNELARTPALRARTFGVAQEVSELLHDRAAPGWNRMQIARLFYHAEHRPGGISEPDFQTLARQHFRIQRLEAHAADTSKRMSDETDPLQVYLSYFNRLKTRLGLPDIFPETMTSPGLHALTADDLSTAANMLRADEVKNFASWFYNWEPLHQYLQKNMKANERNVLKGKLFREKETQLQRLKIEHPDALANGAVLERIKREAGINANEIIYGPLVRALFIISESAGRHSEGTERPAEKVFSG